MADVEFTEEQQYSPKTSYQKTVGGISTWLIKNRFATNEAQANGVMLLTAGVAVVIAIGAPLLLSGSHGRLSPQERALLEQSTLQHLPAQQSR
jgi:hypothetical protein